MKRLLIVLCIFLFAIPIYSGEVRTFTGSNGKAIEAELLGYDSDTEIVRIRLKNGREQNVKIDLFSAKDQDFVRNGGKESDNPFGDNGDGAVRLVSSDRESDIAKTFIKALNEQHVSGKTFDKDMAKKVFEKYIESLDPWKVYFLQSDIDEYRRNIDSFSEKITNGDVSLGFDIYNRYIKRVGESVDIALNILESPIDFNADEIYVLDKSKLTFPKNADELKDRWQKKFKYDILQLKTDGDKNDPVERLKKRYAVLRKNVLQTSNDDLMEIFLTCIGNMFDKNTNYMSPTTCKNWQVGMSGNLVGIGATLTSEDGIVTVKQLITGAPAIRSGKVKVGDKIIGVGQGKNGEIVDVTDMKLHDVVDKIRGQEGTIVLLEIIDIDGNKKIVEIRRDKVKLEDSKAKSEIFTVGKNKSGESCKIGMIRLPSFYQGCANEIKEMLRDMRSKGVDAILLDLSANGGGSFREIVQTVGFFIETGPIIQQQGRAGFGKQVRNDTDPACEWKGPLVLLTSKLTACDMGVAPFQDYGRALIVGNSTTQGKGSMQQIRGIGKNGLEDFKGVPEYGAIKLTIQSIYRVSGKPIHGVGIVSDIALPSILDLQDGYEIDDSFEEKIAPVHQYPTFPFASPEMIAQLKKKSEERIKRNDKFVEVQRFMNQYREKKSVPLNEKKYLAMMKDNRNASKDKLLEDNINSGSKIARDYDLDEVLAITTDYINLLP